MEQSHSSEANRLSASQEIPRILWNTNVHYSIHECPPPVAILSLSDPVMPLHATTWKSILILSSHLRLGLPNGLAPSGFLTKMLYTPLHAPIRATCPAHLILLDFITQKILGEEYSSLSSSLCIFLHSFVNSSPLGPNILLNTLFTNTLSLLLPQCEWPSFTPIQKTDKIIVLYNLSFTFLDRKLEDKKFCTKWKQAFPDFNLLLESSWIEFWCVKVVYVWTY